MILCTYAVHLCGDHQGHRGLPMGRLRRYTSKLTGSITAWWEHPDCGWNRSPVVATAFVLAWQRRINRRHSQGICTNSAFTPVRPAGSRHVLAPRSHRANTFKTDRPPRWSALLSTPSRLTFLPHIHTQWRLAQFPPTSSPPLPLAKMRVVSTLSAITASRSPMW
jgi:hypothetical protein